MKLAKWPEHQETAQHNYHWCPACEKLHVIPDETGRRWTRSGPDDAPTYSPSFLQYDAKGPGKNCHYIITNGILHFCSDSWHGRTDSLPMPNIPQAVLNRLTDAVFERMVPDEISPSKGE